MSPRTASSPDSAVSPEQPGLSPNDRAPAWVRAEGGSSFAEVLRADAAARATGERHDSRGQRTLDIVGATFGLVVLSPVLLIIAAVLVATGHRPIFVHHRLGVGGRIFPCLKFQTMHADAEERLLRLLATDEQARLEWSADQKLTNDPRITSVGKLLRRTNLDELPQLVNVLLGQMSLVGPRPITVGEVVRYGSLYPSVAIARPGLTGLWQVSGRHRLSYQRRVELDLEYVKTASMLGDVRIILITIGQTLLTLLGVRRFGGV